MTSAEIIRGRLFSGGKAIIGELYSLLSHQEYEEMSRSFLARYNGTGYGRPVILLPPPEPQVRDWQELEVWML